MVSGDITKDGLCKRNVDRCGFCGLSIKVNFVIFMYDIEGVLECIM